MTRHKSNPNPHGVCRDTAGSYIGISASKFDEHSPWPGQAASGPELQSNGESLIAGMTGGQRQSIVVDEDFDVTVDGQALDTLSGSGKAVANLALRLGLGQVLTNKVFSLFIGDEIDASLDKDRTENCAHTLQTVRGWLSQIILISHKTMPADYCIDLEGAHGRIQ